ncbi:hypothetical protein [Chitinophaga sp. Cy-1792]|uniref:hypothetical protein n=1 Tax=Chitinophaga sp. Cy-1792 TaxID=2608339 RepID=UPI0014214987|nr:hypothetical protein [Chitinophaga sp. Cy-1792]NIG54842.1 hypothetical protein [Chitinophaga sp. Cy-1792]
MLKYYRYCLGYPFLFCLTVSLLYIGVWCFKEGEGFRDYIMFVAGANLALAAYGFLSFLPMLLLGITLFRKSALVRWLCWWIFPLIGAFLIIFFSHLWAVDEGVNSKDGWLLICWVTPYLVGGFIGWQIFHKDLINNQDA